MTTHSVPVHLSKGTKKLRQNTFYLKSCNFVAFYPNSLKFSILGFLNNAFFTVKKTVFMSYAL